jgi:antitoxin (DNA-binding transcriptional repressor) of toxin-antitoxin stability system
MKQVGLRELKNRLSEYVRLRAGEHVQITDRGQVVAELMLPTPAKGLGSSRGLAALERRGLLRPLMAEGRARYWRSLARPDRHRSAPPRRRLGRALIVYARVSATRMAAREPGGRPRGRGARSADFVTASDLTS